MDDDFGAWIGHTETAIDPLGPVQAQAAQAMLDEPGPALDAGDPLPPLWHRSYFLLRVPQAELDTDGHPQHRGFLPPIPYPSRMFAEARLRWHRPWLVGPPAERQACIRDVVLKSGNSGSLAFVTVGLRFIQNSALCIEVEKDIVDRELGGPVTAPVAAPWPPVPKGSWTRVRQPDSRHIELVQQS